MLGVLDRVRQGRRRIEKLKRVKPFFNFPLIQSGVFRLIDVVVAVDVFHLYSGRFYRFIRTSTGGCPTKNYCTLK